MTSAPPSSHCVSCAPSTLKVEPPPEWAVESMVRRVGRLPAALAGVLNRVAGVPVAGRMIRLFSSVWLGIALLALIGAYIAIGSGAPRLRARLEMTDLQFFDAWPMRVLLGLLVLDLVVVTIRRIPLTLFKLGAWTVHLGILTLIAGCVWYFSCKQEGSVRLFLNQSADYCYDVTERALYAYPVKPDGTLDTAHLTITPLPQLPIYYEHLPEQGDPVGITVANVIAGSDAVVRIGGYYPSAVLEPVDYRSGVPSEAGQGPALALALGTGRQTFGEAWLFARTPAERLLESNLPFAVEYLRHPATQRVRDLQTSFAGSAALTVRLAKLGIERTYVVHEGTPIQIEGSPYTLTPRQIQEMPMLSKGYENTGSTALVVDVERREGPSVVRFRRDCLFRYPERSPDFVEENGRQVRRQDGVDPDIQMVFHDAAQAQAWIVEADDGALALIVRGTDGTSTTRVLEDRALEVLPKERGGDGIELRIARRVENAVPVLQPQIVPAEHRPRGQTVMEVNRLSMLDVEVDAGGWRQPHVFVPFFPYGMPGERPANDQPAILDLPAGNGRPAQRVALLLSTVRRALPSMLTLTRFEPVKYAGARSRYQDYFSTLMAQSRGSGERRTLVTHLNNPASDQGYFYFQAAWDGDDNAPPERRFSVIGVGNHPGVWLLVAGAVLIVLGIGYAFYVKPILLRLKKESLARWARARTASQRNESLTTVNV
jgi:hypothetical protein